MRRLTVILLLLLHPLAMPAAESLEKSRGFRPDQVYQFNGLDSVGLFNGNLNLNIPLGPAYPVDANLSYSFVLRYSGNLWQSRDLHCPKKDTSTSPCVWQYVVNRDNAGMGWFLSFGELLPPGDNVDAGLASSHWRYRASDGAEHLFYQTLHDPACTPQITENCDAATTGTWYSRDGSYLRLVTTAQGKTVEFPDGQRHHFEWDGANWLLKSMRTAQSPASHVSFQYQPNPNDNTTTWVVTDSHGRTHTVLFRRPVDLPYDIVSHVDLQGFNGTPSVYDFEYGLNGSNTFNEIGRPEDTADSTARVWFLSRLVLPEGESYGFDYEASTQPSNTSGVLLQMRLPTLGTMNWTYGVYGVSGGPVLVGVTSKVLRDPAGSELERTHYVPSAGKRTVERRSSAGVVESKTEHHFDDGHQSSFFGLPFSPANPESDRFLSTVTYDCTAGGCAEKRKTYVRYEADALTSACGSEYPCFKDRNRRVVSELTKFVDDGNRIASTDYSGFDGLGHYRVAETSGTFSSGNHRTTSTSFNLSAGTYALTSSGGRAAGFTMLAASAPWILNTFSSSNVTEAGKTFVTDACFDPATGFLLRQRVRAKLLSGTTDLLKVFTRKAGTGFVEREQHFGGDRHAVPGTHSCTDTLPAGNAGTYRIDHTYAAGVLESSRSYGHDGVAMPFLSVSNVIDPFTGLVKESRDSAGLATTLDYDRQFRLKTLSPPGVQSTHYEYVQATSSAPAEIRVRTGTGADAPELRYRFDSLGRLSRELRRMPDDTWAVRETTYDKLSRRIALSEWGTASPSPSRTQWGPFDAFDRAKKVTASDGSETTFELAGNRLVTRTQTVRTPSGDTSVSVREESDRAGRLLKVFEDWNGAHPLQTTYAYDAANRLTMVSMSAQMRTFEYDGRGFLLSEQHPESGNTSYEYDARGHVVKKTAASGTVLEYVYDPAERLRLVRNGAGEDLKEFAYDRSSAGSDRSMGKLDYAIRHNRGTSLAADVTVKETYAYAGLGGRVSSRRTTVSNGTSAQDRTFEDHYAYDTFGNVLDLQYPSCANCPQLTEPSRTVANTYAKGVLTAVPNYASAITYHPSGALKSIRHRNADGSNGPLYTQSRKDDLPRPDVISVQFACFTIATQPADAQVDAGTQVTLTVSAPAATSFQWYRKDGASEVLLPEKTASTLDVLANASATYFVRVGNGSCTIDSRLATVTVIECEPPQIVVRVSEINLWAGKDATFDVVTPIPGASYDWAVTGGTIVSGQGTPAITVSTECVDAYVRAEVTVDTGCGAPTSNDAGIHAIRGWADAFPDPQEIASGHSAVIRAQFRGTPPFTYRWSDETVERTTSAAEVQRTVSPAATTAYRLVSAEDANCALDIEGTEAVITVTVGAPGGVIATALTTSQVHVSWTYGETADSFRVERQSAAGTVTLTAQASPYTDNSAAPGQVYVYRVRAVRGGVSSDASLAEVATTIAFTDDPIVPHVTKYDDVHITELRNAVNALRTIAGIGAAAFTDAGGVFNKPVQHLYVTELRNALQGARIALGLPPVSFTDPVLSNTTPAAAVHVQQLRGGLQ